MKKFLTNKKGFSLLEVLVGMLIFSLGLAAVISLLVTTINANGNNRDRIIASQLSREAIELIRNVRDTNYREVRLWNATKNEGDKKFEPGFYKISPKYDFASPSELSSLGKVNFSQKVLDLDLQNISQTDLSEYELCIDDENKYVYCDNQNLKKTGFYRILELQELKENGPKIENAYQVNAHVIWFRGGKKQFTLRTIIADWKQL